MSWGGLPWWVYGIGYEKEEAMMLGAFAEEVQAGWTRSSPPHIAELDKRRWNDETHNRIYSLGVNIFNTTRPLKTDTDALVK